NPTPSQTAKLAQSKTAIDTGDIQFGLTPSESTVMLAPASQSKIFLCSEPTDNVHTYGASDHASPDRSPLNWGFDASKVQPP
ncbi:hypothetical protein ACFL2H_12435, partial [Planctomycetota bacterium]